MTVEAVIWYLVLLDSVFANVFAWFYPNFGKKDKSLRKVFRHFPLTKGWSGIYLLLVLSKKGNRHDVCLSISN